MSVYKILTFEDSFLREKAKDVIKFDNRIKKLVKNMFDTMNDSKGIGLAAVQIGINKKVIVVNYNKNFFEVINPKIIYSKGNEKAEESCLSIPNHIGIVKRFSKIIVKGKNKEGKPIRIEAEDLKARILQHEIDHLNGILFIDKAKELRKI